MTHHTDYRGQLRRIWRAPGNRGRRLAAIVRSVAWLVNKKTLRRPWTLSVFDGAKVRCYPDSTIAQHVIQRSEFHDWGTAKVITEFLRPGDLFVDVGANIGLYTLAAAAKKARVVAVEPSAKNRSRLEENIALNGFADVCVKACAVGEESGELPFCDADARAHVEVGGQGPTVPIRTLDELLPDGEVSLLKVDVEGFELAVFRGAAKAMRDGRLPVMLFEVNQLNERYGVTDATIYDYLQGHGYKVASYDPDSRSLRGRSREGDILAFTPHGERLIQDRLLVARS